MIRFENVKKRFDDLVVLKGIDLEIQRGMVTAVIGGSGTGKSVLLKHILGLLMPDSGHVFIEDVRVNALSYKELVNMRQKIGMVFQNAALFDSLTVADNLAMGLKRHSRLSRDEIEKEIKWALSLVGLDGVEEKHPAELSGGMRKRAAIARALVMKPEILLYDEPTTGLDPPRADSINCLISDLNKKLGITSVMVTHDMYSMFRVSHMTAMLHDGEILFYGTPEQMLHAKEPIIKEFFKNIESE